MNNFAFKNIKRRQLENIALPKELSYHVYPSSCPSSITILTITVPIPIKISNMIMHYTKSNSYSKACKNIMYQMKYKDTIINN